MVERIRSIEKQNPVTSSGTELATIRLAGYIVLQPVYCMPSKIKV
jgi:hypothetical protein